MYIAEVFPAQDVKLVSGRKPFPKHHRSGW